MNNNKKDPNKVKESIEIRGVCATILEMGMPTLDNLIELLANVGLNVVKK